MRDTEYIIEMKNSERFNIYAPTLYNLMNFKLPDRKIHIRDVNKIIEIHKSFWGEEIYKVVYQSNIEQV